VKQRALRAKGDIIVHISVNALRKLLLLVPPIAEQKVIVTRLKQQCSAYDNAIGAIKNENALLTEYRTRLISDVVTGKLDVRSVTVPCYERVDAVGESEDSDTDDSEESEND
jgi:type I restriction enzyme S subunit